MQQNVTKIFLVALCLIFLAIPFVCANQDKIGVVRGNHTWYLDTNGNGVRDSEDDPPFGLGINGDIPVTGMVMGRRRSVLIGEDGTGIWINPGMECLTLLTTNNMHLV